MADLVALDRCRPIQASSGSQSAGCLGNGASTINLSAWTASLCRHPDSRYSRFILRGLEDGFRIGFNYRSKACRPAKRNMSSAGGHKTVINSYIEEERALRRLVSSDAGSGRVQISPFGVIPKPHQPGKWRLIVDLSSPRGASVNDGIDPRLCSLSYVRIDKAAERVAALGRGAQLAKVDVQNAYRIVPVHPDDRSLLGLRWQGTVLLDTALPFGLRSAPKIFSAVADAVLWMMYDKGLTSGIHYLDDFLFFGAPDTRECEKNLALALEACRDLGIPVATHKVEGPATTLTFLGIEFDTVSGVLRLPTEKLARLKSCLKEWLGRRCCTKRDLLSLIGSLQHAAKVVRPGRTFLRRLVDLSRIPKALHHWVRLNGEARSDIRWWDTFADTWNGVGLLATLGHVQPSIQVQSDAAGSWGCGATWHSKWLHFRWHKEMSDFPIATKEMYPVVLAAFIWGQWWSGQHVLFQVDNNTVAVAVRSGSCRERRVMQLLRALHFVAAKYQFTFTAEHILGSDNPVADAISRDSVPKAFSLSPQLEQVPDHVPAAIIRLLRAPSLDWTSDDFRSQFLACFQPG